MHRYIHYGNYSPGCKVKAARETTASARSNSRLCKMEGRVGSLPMRRLFTMGILWWEPPMAILLQPAFQYVHTLVFSCNVFPLYYICTCSFRGHKRWVFCLENAIQLHLMAPVLWLESKWSSRWHKKNGSGRNCEKQDRAVEFRNKIYIPYKTIHRNLHYIVLNASADILNFYIKYWQQIKG